MQSYASFVCLCEGKEKIISYTNKHLKLMRIKQLLTKTLLVVALLGVGSMSAWADTDCTASVSATGWLKSNGVAAGATSTNFAPAVSAGSMYEVYEETTETTGVMLYQNISDLANGVYQVDLYANAMYTSCLLLRRLMLLPQESICMQMDKQFKLIR